MGYLSPMRYYSMPPDGVANLKEVKTVRGDYDEIGLKNACDRPELIEKNRAGMAPPLPPANAPLPFVWILNTPAMWPMPFNLRELPPTQWKGAPPIKERQRMYQDLRQEQLMVLTSCNVISIGFDEPSVEVGLLLRPTQSSALHLQQIGRVMRISPQTGKQYGIILDQAGNLERLGFPRRH